MTPPARPRKPIRAPRPVLHQALATLSTPPARRIGRQRIVRPAALLAELDAQLVAALPRGAAAGVLELCARLGPAFEAEPERARLWPEYDRFSSPAELVHWRLRILRRRGVLAQVSPCHTDRFSVSEAP